MIEERLVRLHPDFRRKRARPDQLKRDGPVRRPQRHVHGARPVDRGTDRVRVHEIPQLADDFPRESIFACQPVRLTEQRPVLASRKLPRQLDVSTLWAHLFEVPSRQRHAARKTSPRHRVEVPVDGTITVCIGRTIRVGRRVRSAAEQIELVAEACLRLPRSPPRDSGSVCSRSTCWSGRSTKSRPAAVVPPTIRKR